MERSILFFDIDGTIIDERGYIPPSAVEAIHAAQQGGHLCIVNTGRPFGHVDRRVKAIGFDGYICSCGQHIELDGQVVLHAGFDRGQSRAIVALNRKCRLNALYEAEDGLWLDFNDPLPENVQRDRARFAADGLITTGSVDASDFRFDKFCVWESSGSDFSLLRETLRDTCTMIDRGHEHFFECILKDYSKATGVRFLQERCHVPPERCYAFGDSTNDLAMLSAVPHAVAMGNAPDAVKAVCETVTEDLHADGLANAIRRYGLI